MAAVSRLPTAVIGRTFWSPRRLGGRPSAAGGPSTRLVVLGELGQICLGRVFLVIFTEEVSPGTPGFVGAARAPLDQLAGKVIIPENNQERILGQEFRWLQSCMALVSLSVFVGAGQSCLRFIPGGGGRGTFSQGGYLPDARSFPKSWRADPDRR